MANGVTATRLQAAIAVVAGAITVACDWPWRHDMVDQPSRPATAGPRSPAVGSIPLEARGPFDRAAGEFVSNPLPPDASVETGQALYQMYCLPCHGGAVEKYFPKMPSLTAPDVQQHGDGWLYATIANGTTLMPAYGHELDPTERWLIVRFVRKMAE